MNEALDLLCAADMCVDLVLHGGARPRFGQVEQLVAGYVVELGGSANVFASQYVKLGGRAGVIGRVGADAFGRLILEKLEALGLEHSRVRMDPQRKTGLGVTLAEPDDRAILTYLGTIDALGPEDLHEEPLPACRHWHVASYFLLRRLRTAWPAWLARLRRAGVSTSLDTNWDPEERWEGVQELLPHVNVFLPNEAEALAISGSPEVFRAGPALARRGPLVVIKRGAKGALAFDGERHWEAEMETEAEASGGLAGTPADAIGAGDCFDAGFLRAWQLGHPVEACLAWGMRCGRASLKAPGGILAQCGARIPRPA